MRLKAHAKSQAVADVTLSRERNGFCMYVLSVLGRSALGRGVVGAVVLFLGVAGLNNLAIAQQGEEGEPSPSSVCISDPSGDVDPSPAVGDSDVLRFCASYGDVLDLTIGTAGRADPSSDPAWTGRDSRVYIAMTSDALEQTLAVLHDGTRLRADLTDASGADVCSGAVSSAEGSITVSGLGRECFGDASSLLLEGSLEYEADEVVHVDLFGNATQLLVQSQMAEGGSITQPGVVLAERLSGQERFETSARIAMFEYPDGAENVYLTRADTFPDALSGGQLTRGPVLLVPSCGPLPPPIAATVQAMRPTRVVALGSTQAVCDATLEEARAIAQTAAG